MFEKDYAHESAFITGSCFFITLSVYLNACRLSAIPWFILLPFLPFSYPAPLYIAQFFLLPFLPLFCVYASQFVSWETRSTVVVLDAILSWSLSCLYFCSRLPSRFNISCIVFCRHLQTSCLCKEPDVSFTRTECWVTQRTHQHSWSLHRYV